MKMKRPATMKPPANSEEYEVKPWYYHPLQYINLVKRNPNYRIYLLSHSCQHIGDWYIRIASLLTLDKIASDSATAISMFFLVQTVTQVTFSQVGGALADLVDKES